MKKLILLVLLLLVLVFMLIALPARDPGAVHTYGGSVPMALSVKGGKEIAIELDGRPGGPIPIATALGPPLTPSPGA